MAAFEEALTAKRAQQRALEAAEAEAAIASAEAPLLFPKEEGGDPGPDWMAQHEQHRGEASVPPSSGLFEGNETTERADVMVIN